MKLKLRNLLLLSLVFTVAGCVNKQKEEQVVETTKSGLVKSDFQTVLDGDSTNLFVLNNNNGVEVAIVTATEKTVQKKLYHNSSWNYSYRRCDCNGMYGKNAGAGCLYQ